MITITKRKLPTKKLKWILQISEELKKKYSHVSLFDLTVISLNELLNDRRYKMLKFHLKTNATCLFGRDISKLIKPYHVGKPLIKELYQNFDKDINALKELLIEKNNQREFLFKERPLKFWCNWIMRDILRAGGAFVTAKNNTYTRDLQDCNKLFNIKYPQYKKEMDGALKLVFKPTSNKSALLKYLNNFTPKLIFIWREVLNN